MYINNEFLINKINGLYNNNKKSIEYYILIYQY